MNEKEKFKLPSNRNFGLVFFIFFLLVSCYVYFKNGHFSFKLIFISLAFLFFGIFIPKYLTLLNFIWFKFGLLLSRYISPVFMSFVFFGILFPISLLKKIINKIYLYKQEKNKPNKNTYWEDKKQQETNMKDQF